MADLSNVLASVPGLAGYLAKKQMNEAAPIQQMQQASGALQLQGMIAQQQRDQAMREAMAASGGDVEKALSVALQSGNVAAAHQLAPLVEIKRKQQQAQQFQGVDLNTLLDDPQKALAAQAANPHIGPELERLRKVRENKAALEDLRGPQVEGQPRVNPQLATLMQSDVPGIADRAKALNAGIQAPNMALPASYWQTHIENLGREHTSALERRNAAAIARADRIAARTPDPSVMLDKDALETAGWEKLLFGTDAKGMGKASSEQRKQIAEERTRIGKGLGLSPMEIAMMPQDNKVKMKAVDALTKWGAFVDKGAEQLVPSIDLAISYAQKMEPTKLQSLNKAIIAGKTEFNDPTSNAYAVAVNTVRREYARLMSGPTSNAMLPVEAMKQGDQLISTALDLPAWNEVKNVILQDAGFTKAAVKKQIDTLHASMLPPGATPAPATAAPVAASTVAPAPAAAPDSAWTPEKEKRYQELLKKRGGS